MKSFTMVWNLGNKEKELSVLYSVLKNYQIRWEKVDTKVTLSMVKENVTDLSSITKSIFHRPFSVLFLVISMTMTVISYKLENCLGKYCYFLHETQYESFYCVLKLIICYLLLFYRNQVSYAVFGITIIFTSFNNSI